MNQLPHEPPKINIDPWEEMKPHIQQLWLTEKFKLPRVVAEMKTNHGFDAVEHQYKHHFKKWRWKKNVPKAKMDQIAQQIESRARAGKSGTSITLQGRAVEDKKIRRHLKSKARLDSQSIDLKRFSNDQRLASGGPVLAFTNSIFLKWNMPFAAMHSSHARQFDQPFPFSPSGRTPGSDIAAATPSSAGSPHNTSSSVATVVREQVAIDRARLFAQGQHHELLTRLNPDERRQMSDWLYQYWFFSFKTAKHWGKGPTAWTADLLNFDRFGTRTRRSLSATPPDLSNSDIEDTDPLHTPSDLCRWFIHIRADWPYYAEINGEEDTQHPRDQDPNDEATWRPWPEGQQKPQLASQLRNALEHNDFSPTPTTSLPVAIPVIARAAQRSPNELLLEALGFSIMSRNLDQVRDTVTTMDEDNIDYLSLYPLHMAATYLDGSKICCNIFVLLITRLTGPQLRDTFVDELGHTVWDSLMITILKSHSSTTPSIVDETWRETKRFPGEEVDICGRWDADSPAVRQLLASGKSSTPLAWKHKFCHTSVQAICHIITMMFHIMGNPVLHETPSGLYIRRCFHCGAKLQPQTLHSLVITAYHLANNSCQDEDLFGILACLLCFIANDVSIQRIAVISVAALMEVDAVEGQCDHEELTAAGLAGKISRHHSVRTWNKQLQTGWSVFCGVLRLCEDPNTEVTTEQSDELMEIDFPLGDVYDDWYGRECEEGNGNMRTDSCPAEVYEGRTNIGTPPEYPCPEHSRPEHEYEATPLSFRARPDLASLWAATQAETLVHRRLNEHMRWTSTSFSMETLQDQLAEHLPLSVGYHDECLLEPHCPCGRFGIGPLAILSEVINPDIDIGQDPDTRLIKVDCKEAWSRTTYGAFLEEHDY